MVRLLLSLVLLPTLALGQFSSPGIMQGVAVEESGGACATSDSGLTADPLLEGWTGAGNENTWTGSTANGVTIDTDADTSALTTGKPTGACDEALKITIDGSTGTETSIYWNNGSAIDLDTVAIMWSMAVYVDVKPDSGETIGIATLQNNATPATGVAARVLITNSAGQLQLCVADASGTTTYRNLNEDQWYWVDVYLDTSTAGSLSWWDLDSSGSTTAFNRSAVDAQYAHYGAVVSYDANDSATFYVDLVNIDQQ